MKACLNTVLFLAAISMGIACHTVELPGPQGDFELKNWPGLRRAATKICEPQGVHGFGVDQRFWANRAVFVVDCGHLPGLVALAADQDGDVRVLSGEYVAERHGAERSEKRALRNFNEVAKSEGLRIGPDDADDYVRLFLTVHLTDKGMFLSESDAARVLETKWPTDHSFRERLHQDAISIEAKGPTGPFQATVYDWYWPSGDIWKYNVVINRDGTVEFHGIRFGDQPDA